MAKKKTVIVDRTAYEIAQELLEIRDEINVLKAAEKSVSDELRKRMEAGQEQNLFKLLPITTLKIAHLDTALAWARSFAPHIITVNTTAARKIFLADALTGSLGSPEKGGFVLNTVEQLREVKGNSEEDVTN